MSYHKSKQLNDYELKIIRQADFDTVLEKRLRANNDDEISLSIDELFMGMNQLMKKKKDERERLYSTAKTQEEKDLIFFEGNKLPYDKCRRAVSNDYAAYLDTLNIKDLQSEDLKIICKTDDWEGGILILDDINILPIKFKDWMKSFVILPRGGKTPSINNGVGLGGRNTTSIYIAGELPSSNFLEVYPSAVPDNPKIREIILRKVNDHREYLRSQIKKSLSFVTGEVNDEYVRRVMFYENNGSYLDDFEIIKYGRKNILVTDIIDNKYNKNSFTSSVYNFLKFSFVWANNFVENQDNVDKPWILKEDYDFECKKEEIRKETGKKVYF